MQTVLSARGEDAGPDELVSGPVGRGRPGQRDRISAAALAALLPSRSHRGGRRRLAVPAGAPVQGSDPLDVVRMRYARGELGRDEFLQAVRDLGGTPADEAPTEGS